MQLKQLKLAGFKSFVDPTIVPFPSQLVAVVGPNGCGKSNIIDAVRWVMGESSAKNLRGDSMVDVIFNGSSHRKAVGQASIELVFDNSLGRLTGQFASYQEIAVKRVVTRDGDSSYYLNGSRCRRRDITDIFLGTGAGAKGYSIIGQGTISRIIEARPEELRAYLEEAAGVSKYKERRRETLTRIEHTRDNLARVADIREELDKLLQRLERQAKAAERYKILKAEERLFKAEILALKWQALTEEQKSRQNEIKQLQRNYEQHQAKAAEAYRQSTDWREKLQDSNETFQQTQANFYQLATDIARLEENIQQQQREKQRLLLDQQQMQNDWQTASSQLQQDIENRHQTEERHAKLEKGFASLQAELILKQQEVEEKQQQQKAWSHKAQQVQSALAKAQRETQVTQLSLEHLAERRQQILLRLEKINEEQTLLVFEDSLASLKHQQDSLAGLQAIASNEEERYQSLGAELSHLRQELVATEKSLHQAQDKAHRLNTQQAALHAAQQAALGKGKNQSAQSQDLWSGRPRLAETLTVDKDWQQACEWVLAEGLQAIVLDSLEALWEELPSFDGEEALFLSFSSSQENKAKYPRLSDKISGPRPAWLQNLDKIYAIETLDEALQYKAQLQEDESIITANGYWLSQAWVKVAAPTCQDEMGLLLRQEELSKITKAVREAEEELLLLKAKRDELYEQGQARELELEDVKQALSLSREALRTRVAEISHLERNLQQALARKNHLTEESEELSFNLEALADERETAEHLLQTATETAKVYEQEQQQLTIESRHWEDNLSNLRQILDEVRAAVYQTQLELDREKLKIQQLTENIQREESRLERFNERLEALATRLIELELPDSTLQASLAEKLMQHHQLEGELNGQRDSLNRLSSELDSFEALIRSEEKEARALQEKIQQEQMQEQSLAVRAGGILEALAEMNAAEVESLLAVLPPGVTQTMREATVQELAEKIKKLGAINLAAIEEYDVEFQRKKHLDEQYQDLIDALATLDAAIEKMDKETHQRLKATFDQVNSAFQTLFPRLFGGGRAMLELSCDNLLEAGILVMAQPPGKRNSTIHLLSGGEKAMTAVALVFAIFQLNPSPFCMLDEVDAPLDDVNVGRFCALVKEMSEFVQFLFITHNKVTMELAEHLIGVTMREPGVSRIVAVDVEEALAMAD